MQESNDPNVLLDDICCIDPKRVAAALQAAHGRGEELTPLIVAKLEAALAGTDAVDENDHASPGFCFSLPRSFAPPAPMSQ